MADLLEFAAATDRLRVICWKFANFTLSVILRPRTPEPSQQRQTST